MDSLDTAEEGLGNDPQPPRLVNADPEQEMEGATGDNVVTEPMETHGGPLSAPITAETEWEGPPGSPAMGISDQVTIQPSVPRDHALTASSPPLGDMDCPVCFSRYNIYRVPKRLTCHHHFCALCLKLIVQHQNGAWVIVCPICRAPTAVFGGLICTLENQESLMSRLEAPEVQERSPKAKTHSSSDSDTTSPVAGNGQGKLRLVAWKMACLLLILLILLILILMFAYSGGKQCILGFILGFIIIITVLLCFNSSCKMSHRMGNRQKDNSIISTA
ncbi:E3 ubiquitin-protein ligase RNF186 [Pelodytes ibericus]